MSTTSQMNPAYVAAAFEGGPAGGTIAWVSARQGVPRGAVLVAMLHGHAVPFDPPRTDAGILDEAHSAGVPWTRYVRVSAEPIVSGHAFRYIVDPLDPT